MISRVESSIFFQARNGLCVALLDIDRTLDDAHVARAGIGFRAIHEAIERPDDVIGGHLAAVVEDRVVAQLVGIDQPIRRRGDCRCQFEHRLVVGRVPIVKRAVNGLGVDLVLRAVRGMDVEIGEARTIRRGEPDRPALARRLRFSKATHCQHKRRGDSKFF